MLALLVSIAIAAVLGVAQRRPPSGPTPTLRVGLMSSHLALAIVVAVAQFHVFTSRGATAASLLLMAMSMACAGAVVFFFREMELIRARTDATGGVFISAESRPTPELFDSSSRLALSLWMPTAGLVALLALQLLYSGFLIEHDRATHRVVDAVAPEQFDPRAELKPAEEGDCVGDREFEANGDSLVLPCELPHVWEVIVRTTQPDPCQGLGSGESDSTLDLVWLPKVGETWKYCLLGVDSGDLVVGRSEPRLAETS